MEHTDTGEIDVLWDENGNARYRILKSGRMVDFEGKSLGFIDEEGNIFDYKDGRQLAFYENGILRDVDGAVVALGQEPAGAKPVLPDKGLIPSATEPETEPKKPKPKKAAKKPAPGLLWSKKIFEEL